MGEYHWKDSMKTRAKNIVSRRVLAKGAMWAAPVVAATAFVPSHAVSNAQPTPRVSGNMQVKSECFFNTDNIIRISNVANYPRGGFWVEEAQASSKATDAKIIFYFPTNLGDLKWRAQRNNGLWSTPTYDSTAPTINGFRAYTTTYHGTWEYNGKNRILLTTSGMEFVANGPQNLCRATVTTHAIRSVKVDGVVRTKKTKSTLT